MKAWLATAVVVALTMAASLSAQTPAPPVVAQVPVPPPPGTVQRDGPYRLLLHAKVDARERRAHGLRADVVWENGMWWVVYYP